MGKLVLSSVFCTILIGLLIHCCECGRFSSRGRVSRPSSSFSRPSASTAYKYHPSTFNHPSYSAPSPPASRPSQPAAKPIGWNVDRNNHPPSSSSGTHQSSSGSTHVERPVGPPVQSKPVQSGNNVESKPPIGFNVGKPSSSANQKPIGFDKTNGGTGGTNTQSQQHQIGFEKVASEAGHGNRPVGPPTNVKPVASAPPNPGNSFKAAPPPYTPHDQKQAPPAYSPHNPAGYGPPPAYNPAGYGPPASNPAGYGPPPAYSPHGQAQYHPQGNYPQQGYYPHGGGYPQQGYYPQPGGGYYPHSSGGATIINNNYHYGGGGGGYYGGVGYPSYHYSSSDVGSGALGFFLGYSLAKITTPSYSFTGYGGGYTPRYDHYTVHHYYHNSDAVPKESTIQPNAIVGCIGDSGRLCPQGTTSLCTNNGAVLCVASATTTVPCSDNNKLNCVKSEIPCVQGEKCDGSQNKTSVNIPCISSAKVYGELTFVNNTIIVNATMNGVNSTAAANSSITPNFNGTASNNSAINVTHLDSSVSPLVSNDTVMVSDARASNQTSRRRRDSSNANIPVQNFCVTILALPAERKPSEGEKFAVETKSIFSKFLVKSFGID